MIRDFEHLAPNTLDEALTLLDKYRDECKVIAGGQSLIVLMRHGLVLPKYLIDIKRISELNYINSGKDGLRIGSVTSHRAIEKSTMMKNGLNVLSEMEKRLSYIQTRNWGTIGGSLCTGNPAGDPGPVLMALNASVTMASVRGKRTMPLGDFFLDSYKSALEPDELLTEIQIPDVPPHTGTVYKKFTIIEGHLAIVGVAVSITLKSGDSVCDDIRIALGGSAKIPMRAKKAEEVLRGKEITDTQLKEAAQTASTEAEPISDISASDEYRRELVKIMVAQTGSEALARAKQV